MESDSPPRKKLKQARLPFQILSHKETSETTQPTTNRKRQLSEDSSEDVVVSKAVKTSEETKENVTDIDTVQEAEDIKVNPSSSSQDEEKAAAEPSAEPSAATGATAVKLLEATAVKPPQDTDTSVKAQEGSILQKMKSNLANLLDKKAFDINAEVGRCDCGCEDADSEEEAMKEYIEHTSKGKPSPKSKQSTPKEKGRRKSGAKKDSKQSSPSKKSPSQNHKSKRQSIKTLDDDGVNPGKKVEPEKQADAVSDPQPPEPIKKPERNSILSQKAVDMFAKWRKSNSCDSEPKDENDKDKTQLSKGEEIKVDSLVSKEAGEEQKQNDGSSSDKYFSRPHDSENNEKKKDKDIDHTVEGKELTTIGDVLTTPKASTDKKDLLGNQGCIVIDDEELNFPLTPTGLNKTPQRRLTPKQLERQKEVARKQEEKERLKLEKENEKKRLKQEKDEQKRKEKEDKEEQRRKEKEEKEKKKQAELEQKNEEKRKKENLKAEEKRKKEEDKKKADEEKRKAEEEEERKKAKASALFTKFFVPKSSKTEREEVPPPTSTVQNFMPFEVKADMKIAPLVRHTLTSSQKHCLDEAVKANSNVEKSGLYLHSLRSGVINPKVAFRTWPLEEIKEDDDVSIIEEANDAGVLISEEKKVEKMKAKFLQFHENHRPAYHGTWRKTSTDVTGRRPFGQEKILDYEVDSADEWEEEEPGESLHGSDDEKEKESDDEYEVDNGVFVPHGYLSEDEGDEEENEEVLSPETQKAKLKLLGEEFEAQMKSKTSALKPIIIVLTAALQASSLGSSRYQKLLERRAVWREDEGAINLSQLKNDDCLDGQGVPSSDPNCVTFTSGPGAKKKIISEEAIPALITLVHGNQNKRVFLTNEFSAFLGKSRSSSTDNAEETALAGQLEASGQPIRPSTPSAPTVNPLTLKWPGLPPASRISISNKIKEIATWGACPEEGPLHNRMCWYVPEETRVKYGLVDMKLPNNQWHYTLKPKVFNHSNSPVANGGAGSASGAESRALITKFTKVMTPEEKQRQWESMKNAGTSTPSTSKLVSAKGSTGKITAFTQKVNSPANVDSKQEISATSQSGSAVAGTSGQTSTSDKPPAKKRVALLVSVPRGQQITSSSHCSLLSKFEAASPNSSSVKNVPNSNNEDGDCIMLE